MNITDFAEKYRLKVRRSADDDGDLTINGRAGQIYTYSHKELGVSFLPGLDKNGHGIGSYNSARSGGVTSGGPP